MRADSQLSYQIVSSLLRDDKNRVRYLPKLNTVVGSVLATILLLQIEYWWGKYRRPFYKYKLKPTPKKKPNGEVKLPPLYKDGDSWCEELGFSRSEFDRALTAIAEKITQQKWDKQQLPERVFVWYWTDMQRVTRYALNESHFIAAISGAYGHSEPNENNELSVTQDAALNKAALCNTQGSFTDLDITETTTEITNKPAEGGKTQRTEPVRFRLEDVFPELTVPIAVTRLNLDPSRITGIFMREKADAGQAQHAVYELAAQVERCSRTGKPLNDPYAFLVAALRYTTWSPEAEQIKDQTARHR